MSVRIAGPDEDWGAILALIRGAFAGMDGRINPPSSALALTPAVLARQAARDMLWLIGTPPVACVLGTVRGDALYLSKLAVAPDAQRRGHARALIAAAETCARTLRLAALTLSTRVELAENHATFRALGFAEVGRSTHPGFAQPTSVVFRKDLP